MSAIETTGEQVAIVLGSGLLTDGTPAPATVARAHAAANLAKACPNTVIIACGKWAANDTNAHPKTEAQLIADLMIAAGISPAKVLLENDSQDTLGNAIFAAARFLYGHRKPSRVIVVTSPFHQQRVLYVFQQVLGPCWPVTVCLSEKCADDDTRALKEATAIANAQRFCAGIVPGNVPAFVQRALERQDLYKQLDWLAIYGGQPVSSAV